MNNSQAKYELYSAIGFALIILSICLGIGGCSVLLEYATSFENKCEKIENY